MLKPRTNPTCASIIASCMAPALTNAGLVVKLVQGLTKCGSYPAHIGLEIPARPAARCFCHQHPVWPSRTMTIGAASGPLRLLEFLCPLHFFVLVEIDKPLNSLFAPVYSATDDPDAIFVVEALFCLYGFLCVCVKPCYQGIPYYATHAGGHSMSLGLCPRKLTSGMGREDWSSSYTCNRSGPCADQISKEARPLSWQGWSKSFAHTTSVHPMAASDVQSCLCSDVQHVSLCSDVQHVNL